MVSKIIFMPGKNGEMNRRDFLKLGLAAGAGLILGEACQSENSERREKNKKIFDPDKFEEENFGESIQPERKGTKEDFVESETIYLDFLQAIDSLPPAEREKLKQEWGRIAQKERGQMYKRRFNNSDEQVLRFFKRITDHEPYRKQLTELVEKYGAEHGVPIDLLLGVIGVESGGDPNARSTSKPSARGILQLMPITAREMGLKVELNAKDEVIGVDERYDVIKNIKAGARYLAKMKERFGSWGLALIAFCEGPTELSKQLRYLKVPDKQKTIVHLYSRKFFHLGDSHPFQYPFYVNAMSRQMLSVMNDGRTLSIL